MGKFKKFEELGKNYEITLMEKNYSKLFGESLFKLLKTIGIIHQC